LSDFAAWKLLADLVEERTGFHYPEAQLDIFADKLAPRLRELHLRTGLDYYYLLKYDPEGEQEWSHLISELVVPETYFYREFAAVRHTVDNIVPELLAQRPGQRLRIWHAACCSGEEPYTMAIALREAGVPDTSVEIVASDLDASAILRARRGLYNARSVRTLPVDWLGKYFQETEQRFQLNADIRSRVRFQVHNLLDTQDTGRLATFDVIFCRNVFIYFRPAIVQRVVNSLYALMPGGGCLFLGACESLLRLTTLLRLEQQAGVAYYVKDAS
jgi:chemotaxis protein methyltransferase CheR